MPKPKIFVLLDYYIPGFKSGGPLRTIANTVDRLGDQVDFFILTRDRDATDMGPYPGLRRGVWSQVGQAQVYYAAPEERGAATIRRLVRQVAPDTLYLNSFFSKLTVLALGLRRLGLLPVRDALIAPRGEFSPGALQLKAAKKRAFLRLALPAGLYGGLRWQATSPGEADDIRRVIGPRANVALVPNLPEPPGQIAPAAARAPKAPGAARLVFLSRVAEKKNLHFLLELLPQLRGRLTLDVYGPIREPAYWRRCEAIIAGLPATIRVDYHGPLEHDLVGPTLSGYDFFALPTLGENFGHAILEAFAAGCPPLVSDQTPWRRLERRRLGWDLPLHEPRAWTEALQRCVDMGGDEHAAWSAAARRFAADYQVAAETERATMTMLTRASGPPEPAPNPGLSI
jgi:glycosyltransferase involved in cell wall biosynthesis